MDDGTYDRKGIDRRTRAERTRSDGGVDPIRRTTPALRPVFEPPRMTRPPVSRTDLRPSRRK